MDKITEMLEDFPEDVKFVLTEEYLLFRIITDDYGVDVGEWRPKLWKSIFEDFMEGLEKMGTIVKADKEQSS